MKTLAELKAANLPRLTAEAIGLTVTPKDPAKQGEADELIAQANKYLEAFTPTDGGKCIQCDTEQGGLLASIRGGFAAGFIHGEGACLTCGYPGRFVHKITGIGTLSNMILQYHPDMLGEEQVETA